MIKVFLPHYSAIVCIDLEDLPILSAHRWYVRNLGNSRYVTRNEAGRSLFLHREILRPRDDLVVDHIDGNGLNNCRANLRAVTHRQNLWNRTRHKNSIGISWSARKAMWRAYIEADGGKIDLGFYESDEEARVVRDMASLKIRGAIGTLNFADGDLPAIDWLKLPPAARRLLLAAA